MEITTELEAHCDLESLHATDSGTIWGGVWIQHGEYSFPEVGWSDIAVAFLVELMLATSSLSKPNTSARVSFFDGPLELELAYRGSDLLIMETKGPKKARPRTLTASLKAWKASLHECAIRVVEECAKRSWSDQSDVRNLRQLTGGVQ
jgi:hypothetical protein